MRHRYMVRVGDLITCIEPTFLSFGKTMQCTRADSDNWYYIDGNGNEDWWANPMSGNFEVSKNTIIHNILNDL